MKGNVALLKQSYETAVAQNNSIKLKEPKTEVIQVTLPVGTQAVPTTVSLPAGTQAVPSTIQTKQSSSEELIRRQQQEIEMLKKSLEQSQNALKEQQMALQLSQQNDVQVLLSQQLRNNQIQLHQLQTIQRQIYSDQSSLMFALQPTNSPSPSPVSMNSSSTSSGTQSQLFQQQPPLTTVSNSLIGNLSPLEEKTMDADKLILKQVVMDKPRFSIIR